MNPIDDACAARKAAFAGEWARANCPTAPQWCLGEMEPGRHVSINYEPFVKAPDWDFDYGRFAFTVPGGWATQEDSGDGYVLKQRDGPKDAAIYLFNDVLSHARSKGCIAKPVPGVGSSAAAIYHWIRSLPGLKISHVVEDVSVGGIRGYQIDLDVDPSSAGTCPWTDGKPTVELFANAQSETADGGFDWGICCDGRMRLFILDEGPDRALVVDIEAPDEAAWQALVRAAMPIVESFEFMH